MSGALGVGPDIARPKEVPPTTTKLEPTDIGVPEKVTCAPRGIVESPTAIAPFASCDSP